MAEKAATGLWSLTRLEYWILESAVKYRYRICWLASRKIEDLYNKQSHGCSIDCLAQTMEELNSKRLIVCKRNAIALNLKASDFYKELETPSGEAKGAKGPPSNEIYYGLTPRGGRVWEDFARPNWSKFILEKVEGRHMILMGCDKNWLEYYLTEVLKYLGKEVLKNTLYWEPLKKWRATYWKVISPGHKVAFEFRRLFKEESIQWERMPLVFSDFTKSLPPLLF